MSITTQLAVKTNTSDVARWRARPSYPVEELFELLHEQLHSAGLHRSAERAVKELRGNAAKEVYLLDLRECVDAAGSAAGRSRTHLIHAVALPNNGAINSVLGKKKMFKTKKKRDKDSGEPPTELTSISSSWYSIVGGLPSLFGFSIIGLRTT